MEGKFCYGRTHPFCDSAEGWREHGRSVPGVRNVSQDAGYKIFERYEECGLEGLTDRARRPHRYANQLPEQIEAAIVAAKREKPNWGARKIRERLLSSPCLNRPFFDTARSAVSSFEAAIT
jgi:hypothetical protein